MQSLQVDQPNKTPYEKVKHNNVHWKKVVYGFMDSIPSQIFLTILLLLSLFLTDSWTLGNASDNTNDILYGILVFIFVVFLFESIILSVVQDTYFLGFFFWMDVVGTLSIILDIGWIANTFMPKDTDATSKGSLLRAARAAKLGARYGRLMRLMKIFKFIKALPCFKNNEEEELEPSMSAVRKVSAKLSEVLSRRVAALVMVIVIVVPFLSYLSVDFSTNAWLSNFQVMMVNPEITYQKMDDEAILMYNFYRIKDTRPLSVSLTSPFLPDGYDRKFHFDYEIRSDNVLEYHGEKYYEGMKYTILIVINNTIPSQWNAVFGIILIILVILALVGFSASFQGSVDELVVLPLEKMMSTLRKSATAMLKSMQAMKKEDEDDEEDDSELETSVLEKMVEKLARIVKHVTNNNDLIVDDNVDKATANWLNQNYAQNSAPKPLEGIQEQVEHKQNSSYEVSTVNGDVVNSWSYDVLLYSHTELFEYTRYMLDVFSLFQDFSISRSVYEAFILEISNRYINTNTYHNFHHGCDVMQTCYRLIMVSHLHLIFNQIEIFSVLIGSLAHDVGHIGVNNAFLVKTRHPLAMIHNDKSPLENMHCSLLYEILSNPDMDIFQTLTSVQWKESRKIILNIILGTDMVHHFDQVSKTQLFLEVNGEDVKRFCNGQHETIECFAEEKNRLFVMELLLHCSDISNPYKPHAICAKWANVVAEEFFQQGDKERELLMEISPMMDRNNSNLNNMQMGFIEFVVSPLINSVVNLLPSLSDIGQMMLDNFVQWGEKRKVSKSTEECAYI